MRNKIAKKIKKNIEQKLGCKMSESEGKVLPTGQVKKYEKSVHRGVKKTYNKMNKQQKTSFNKSLIEQ